MRMQRILIADVIRKETDSGEILKSIINNMLQVCYLTFEGV